MIDTGGIEPDSKDIILSQMREQAANCDRNSRCDRIYHRCTARACRCRCKSGRYAAPVRESRSFLVVNKVDSFEKFMPDVYEFYNLGIGDPISGFSSFTAWDR